jgi:methylenetetrahydrofolate dehydrogenase (NADP+)/methenyltetrahydrofolate cyclohydrolase
MDTQILSGKVVSASVYENLKPRIEKLLSNSITPGLAVVLVGDDAPSLVYVKNKTKKFLSLGLFSETIRLNNDVSQDDLIDVVNNLNNDNKYHGILVQLPLPSHINNETIINAISPNKDVDGFHPVNFGHLAAGKPTFIPCTPKGIMRVFKHYNIDLSNKHVVVVGRSNIVGRPISILTSLKRKDSNATTTICHSGTKNISYYTKQADIVILALGYPEFLKGNDIKEGAVVIDVGINRIESTSGKGYMLLGDCDQSSIKGHASALTPVPGGIGPMTIAMLVENTIEAAEMELQ